MSPDNDRIEIEHDKSAQFAALFEEFTGAYLSTPDGQRHAEMYQLGREEGCKNFEEVVAAAEQGEDIEDLVLLKLLPYSDSSGNREKGAWIHIAPTVTGNIKGWFESKHWTQPEDWPRVTQAILSFVQRCYENPQDLQAACDSFAASPYAKGFQAAMLSPILNALRPDEFLLINNKPRQVINYLANESFGHNLTEYPALNATGQQLVRALAGVMDQFDVPHMLDQDLFDMFSHWLVAVKEFDFRPIDYWKIAPGEGAWNWDACREGDFIAVGWDEFGNISGLTRSEFDAIRDELIAKHEGWTKTGADQVWTFSQIRTGDRIVANRGTTQILGIGTVSGPYRFVEAERHRHQLPVKWEDHMLRQVDEPGWRRTVVKIGREKFEALTQAPPAEGTSDLAQPFSKIFESMAEAEWAFDLLTETFQRLGITQPDDRRFALTLRHDERVLRLNFGNWAILQFCGPSYSQYRVGMALIDELADIPGEFRQWGPFAQSTPSARVYELPIDLAMPLEGDLRQAYERTFSYLADRFRLWNASNFRRFNQSEIAEVVFDVDKRAGLLQHGLGTTDQPPLPEEYTDEDFLTETYLTREGLDELTALLEDKMQIILYGPPGTGKTYVAQKLALYFVGGDERRIQLIQFHPSYSYEEFMEGIRPEERAEGPPAYPVRPGVFRAFCEEASSEDGRFVMIIDEINRGNIAKIFGELMFLLEYRDREVPLPYSGVRFSIPDNVYIIGTMNTADRSIALVDFALRRRFRFIPFGADRAILERWLEANAVPVPYLLELFDEVNRAIDDRDYRIGFSYFMKPEMTEADLRRIWRYSIEPYLEEYFFDNRAKVEELRWDALVSRLAGRQA